MFLQTFSPDHTNRSIARKHDPVQYDVDVDNIQQAGVVRFSLARNSTAVAVLLGFGLLHQSRVYL